MDDLLQGAVVFRFALNYFKFDDVGVVFQLDSQVNAAKVGDVLRL